MAHIMKAKYNGICPRCGEDITAGEPVKWLSRTQPKLIHACCIAQGKETPTPEVQDELERTFLRGEFYPDVVIG